ncbi:vitellogenin [Sarcoptes scabiei]|nr:vitellogenin [Sarcoptes scabiei]
MITHLIFSSLVSRAFIVPSRIRWEEKRKKDSSLSEIKRNCHFFKNFIIRQHIESHREMFDSRKFNQSVSLWINLIQLTTIDFFSLVYLKKINSNFVSKNGVNFFFSNSSVSK